MTLNGVMAVTARYFTDFGKHALVSPGAATDGVTPSKNWRLFCSSLSLFHFTRVYTPLEGVTPDLFYLSDLVSPRFFVNSATIFFIRVSPPGGCHPGRSDP